jgi:hypothetical protein
MIAINILADHTTVEGIIMILSKVAHLAVETSIKMEIILGTPPTAFRANSAFRFHHRQ